MKICPQLYAAIDIVMMICTYILTKQALGAETRIMLGSTIGGNNVAAHMIGTHFSNR